MYIYIYIICVSDVHPSRTAEWGYCDNPNDIGGGGMSAGGFKACNRVAHVLAFIDVCSAAHSQCLWPHGLATKVAMDKMVRDIAGTSVRGPNNTMALDYFDTGCDQHFLANRGKRIC